MRRVFSASVQREDGWYVAQCLEVDVASQGETHEAALSNLREALDLYFESPTPTLVPLVEGTASSRWAGPGEILRISRSRKAVQPKRSPGPSLSG